MPKNFKKIISGIKDPASERVKAVLADSLMESGQENIAELVNRAPNLQQAFTDLNANMSNQALNTMVGNLFGFIAKQVIASQNVDNIFGNNFREGEKLNAGSGINYVEVILNGVGSNNIVNYQTSTDSTGAIALGDSFTNSNQLQIEYQSLPFSQPGGNAIEWAYTWKTILNGEVKQQQANLLVPFFRTFNKTIPVIWAQFSTLSAIEIEQLLNNYYADVENAVKIYKYSLGNLLFSEGCKPNLTLNRPQDLQNHNNIYFLLQKWILPELINMKKLTADYNAGDFTKGQGNWASSTAWPTYFYNSVNINQNGYTKAVLNNGMEQNLRIFMNENVSSAIVSILNMPAMNQNGSVLDIHAENGVLKSILGIPVTVTGSLIGVTQQAPQGAAVTPQLNISDAQLLDDWTIMVVSDDYLTFTPIFEQSYTSDVFGNAMIKTVRKQIAFMPVLKPWKTGVIFSSIPKDGQANLQNSFTQTSALPVVTVMP